MARAVGSGPPVLLRKFDDVTVDGDTLVFDWAAWGDYFTALAFQVVNKGAGEILATPEMSPDGVNVISRGVGVPVALSVPAGETSHDPYGIDIVARFWRLWLAGTSTADVYVFGIKRGA